MRGRERGEEEKGKYLKGLFEQTSTFLRVLCFLLVPDQAEIM